MTDRERLIELLGLYLPINEPNGMGSYDTVGARTLMRDDREKLADHLLENGVIVPPCKVGDTVYLISGLTDTKNIIKCTVTALHITSGKNRLQHRKPSHILLENEIMPRLTSRVYFEEFGKTVFLTPDEAEQALAEREGKNEEP